MQGQLSGMTQEGLKNVTLEGTLRTQVSTLPFEMEANETLEERAILRQCNDLESRPPVSQLMSSSYSTCTLPNLISRHVVKPFC